MEPNENVEEQNNMDSAPGNMPAKATPESLHKNAPEGEYNPFKRNLVPHEERHKYVKEGIVQKGNLLEEADLLADFDNQVALLPPGQEQEEMKSQHALSEFTQKSNKMIAKRDEDLMKQWIEQNPVPAAALGLTAEDPYGLYAETRFLANTAGIPEEDAIALEKEKRESPIAKRKPSPLTQIGYDTYVKMYSNPMANIGARAGNIIAEKMAQWDQRRAQQLAEDEAQYQREVQDFDDNFGGYIQTAESSPHVDEATKELMAQDWKQQFAQLNADKNAIPPRITPEEYAMKKNQLLGNAKQYTQAVQNVESAAQNWVKALQEGTVSNGTPRSQRDLLQTIAAGKGMNISTTQDGKNVTGKGLSIQNINGAPTMVGYTEGQLAKIRQEYDQQAQAGMIKPEETSFEAYVANMRPVPGSPGYEEKPDYWKGVSIPISQLANNEGMPKFVPKDPQFEESVDGFAKDLAAQSLTGPGEFNGMSLDDKWGVVEGRAQKYAQQMIEHAPMDTMRSIASDYLGMPYEEFEDLLKNKNGVDGVRSFLAGKITDAIKADYMSDPNLIKQNQDFVDFAQQRALQTGRQATQGGGRQTNADKTRAVNQAAFDSYLKSGDIADLSGVLKGIQFQPAEKGWWGTSLGASEESLKIKKPDGSVLDLSNMAPEQQKRVLAQTLGLIYEPSTAQQQGSGGTKSYEKYRNKS